MDVWQISDAHCATQCFVWVNTNGRWMLRGSAGQRRLNVLEESESLMFSFGFWDKRGIDALKIHRGLKMYSSNPTQGREVVDLLCRHHRRTLVQHYSYPGRTYSGTPSEAPLHHPGFCPVPCSIERSTTAPVRIWRFIHPCEFCSDLVDWRIGARNSPNYAGLISVFSRISRLQFGHYQ